ncbi:MAG: SCO family protein [Planctomycetes bacterium]|nr:SCO family protein [Planctomycetota bacterium]
MSAAAVRTAGEGRFPVLPLSILAAVWMVALLVWALATVDLDGVFLEDAARDVRAYCFGWDRPDRGAAIGGTLVMAGVPVVLSSVTILVWRRELLGGGRARGAFLALAGLALAGAGGVALAGASGRARGAPVAVALERKPAPDCALADARGTTFRLSEARGKVVCLTFFYTSCHSTCPEQLGKLLVVQDAFREGLGEDLLIVAVSIDPVRDDRFALGAYGARLGCDPAGWRFVGGDRETLDGVLDRWGVVRSVPKTIGPTTQIGHEALIALVDRSGNRAFDFRGTSWSDSFLLEKVAALLDEE